MKRESREGSTAIISLLTTTQKRGDYYEKEGSDAQGGLSSRRLLQLEVT